MTDPTLWTGLVMLTGTLGAIAARAGKLPAASGALVGGFLLVTAAHAGGWTAAWPDLVLIRWLLVAFLCLLLGVELDLTRLTKLGRSVPIIAIAQAAVVLVLVTLGAGAFGMAWPVAIGLGAAAGAASPVAIIATTSEARARGDFTQRLLALGFLSPVLAMLLLFCAVGPAAGLPGIAASLIAGGLCGGILLVPLSRMSTRGPITACVGAGAILLTGAAMLSTLGLSAVPPTAIVAGFLIGNLVPNRELIREALRDLALPVSVALFAIAGSTVLLEQTMSSLPLALTLIAARLAGLALVATLTPLDGALMQRMNLAAALIPMSGFLAIALMLAGSTLSGRPETADALSALVTAALISEAVGMAGTRWALSRSGEGAALSEDPDAWRATMR